MNAPFHSSGRRRVVVIQPAFPAYRMSFFNAVAAALGARFAVYASPADMGVLTGHSESSSWQEWLGPMLKLAPGVEWQTGASNIPFAKGDIVVIPATPRALSNLMLMWRAHRAGAVLVLWGHFWSSTSKPWRSSLRYALFNYADALLFYTDEEIEHYRRLFPDRTTPLFALNNGIDTGTIEKWRETFDAARPRDLLFIGRLTDKVDFPLLLGALARPECKGVTLDVVGGGPGEGALKELAEELGLSGRIHWHGGTADEQKIAAVANRCRAFVYPGGVGLSLIHGLAYGLPAVVHDDRWKHMPEIAAFSAGRNGLAYRNGDVSSLAVSIATLLADNDQLRHMSEVALATTAASFNTAAMARRFMDMISAIEPGARKGSVP